MPEILKITDLVDDPNAPEWADYPEIPGFKVRLRLPDIPETTTIMARTTSPDGTDEAGKPKFRLDFGDYQNRLLQYAVTDWQGLKAGDLAKLLPQAKVKVRTAGGDACATEAELAFCPENLDFLLRKSAPFYKWASERVKAKEEALQQQEESDSKN